MRRALALSLVVPSLTSALLGDWKVWTSTNNAHHAVMRDASVMVATDGGVLEWEPGKESSRLYTTLDGLPEIQTIALASDNLGSIWAVGAGGRLARLSRSGSRWEVYGSYAASGWTFRSHAVTSKDDLIALGGPRGLSLFSTTQRLAVDNIPSILGKSIQVNSALFYGDTLFVGTDKGTAKCLPDAEGWSKSGTPGHYLTDPSRWRWVDSLPNRNLVADTHVVFTVDSTLWGDNREAIFTNGLAFAFKGKYVVVPGASHALKLPDGGYLVSSSITGPMQVLTDGTVRRVPVPNTLPIGALPISVAASDAGEFIAMAHENLEAVLIRRSRGSNEWTKDPIEVDSGSGSSKTVIHPTWDPIETIRRLRLGLTVDAQGQVAAPAYVARSWGGVYLASEASRWFHLGQASDTCFHRFTTSDGDLGPVLLSARAQPSGFWFSELISPSINLTPYDQRIYLLPKGTKGPMRCVDLPTNTVTREAQTLDMVEIGSVLWLGTSNGLFGIDQHLRSLGRGTASLLQPEGIEGKSFTRLLPYSMDGQDWIVAGGEAQLGLFDPVHSKYYPLTDFDQTVRSLVVDSKNQVWAATGSGIDILQPRIEQDTAGNRIPTLDRIRHIGRADGLPEEDIYSLALDVATGRALLASPHALTLWASPYRPLPEKLEKSNIKVWPNPLRLSKTRTLFVDGVTEKADFSLLAQDGTMVLHLPKGQQTSGVFQIDLPDPAKLRPGLYFWAVKDGNSVVKGPLLIGF